MRIQQRTRYEIFICPSEDLRIEVTISDLVRSTVRTIDLLPLRRAVSGLVEKLTKSILPRPTLLAILGGATVFFYFYIVYKTSILWPLMSRLVLRPLPIFWFGIFLPEFAIFFVVYFVVVYRYFEKPSETLVFVVGSWMIGDVLFFLYWLLPEVLAYYNPENLHRFFIGISIEEFLIQFPICVSLSFAGGFVGSLIGFLLRKRTDKNTEQKVLSYVESHEDSIQVFECAKDMDMSINEVERALQSLSQRRKSNQRAAEQS